MANVELATKEVPSKRETKRQMLIDIGTTIFTQKGFSITSLDEIVMTAEIPKGSFYYYFQGAQRITLQHKVC